LLDALAPLELLIVLDNCERLIGGCATTTEAIVRRCPRVRLVATSREPLGVGGEMIYRVPSLSLPGPGESGAAAASCDAVVLFAARARRRASASRWMRTLFRWWCRCADGWTGSRTMTTEPGAMLIAESCKMDIVRPCFRC
jgi:predicted ATPase